MQGPGSSQAAAHHIHQPHKTVARGPLGNEAGTGSLLNNLLGASQFHQLESSFLFALPSQLRVAGSDCECICVGAAATRRRQFAPHEGLAGGRTEVPTFCLEKRNAARGTLQGTRRRGRRGCPGKPRWRLAN